jgi:hypothetical protein
MPFLFSGKVFFLLSSGTQATDPLLKAIYRFTSLTIIGMMKIMCNNNACEKAWAQENGNHTI